MDPTQRSDRSREGRWYGQTDWADPNHSQRDRSADRPQRPDWSAQNPDRSGDNPSRSGAEREYDANYWDRYSWDDSTASSQSGSSDDSTLMYTYVIYSEPFFVGTIQPGSVGSQGQNQPNWNQQSQNQEGQNQQWQDQNHLDGRNLSQSSGSGKRSTMSGKIEGVRQMRLQDRTGRAETFTLAKVKLDNGTTTVISLGEQNRLRAANLKKGDRIQATGHRGEIDGQSIFVAQQLQTADRTFAVNEVVKIDRNASQRMAGPSYGETQSPRMQGGSQSPTSTQGGWSGSTESAFQQTIQGRVAHFERAVPYQGQRAHTYVRVTLEDGRTQLIDLGDDVSINAIDLRNGDRISVRGHEERVGSRLVIVAQQLRIDGEQVLPAAE